MDEGHLNYYFPTLYMFIRENNLNLIGSVELLFAEYVSQLIGHFQNDFPGEVQQQNRIN